MPGLAVNVAVIDQNKILLTKREDFETWILPSGGVEDRESFAQAAIRETKEETGLDVELTGLVGVYSRLGNMAPVHAVLFSARLIGGDIKCQEGETIAVEWFDFDKLPEPLSAGQRKRIEDAIVGKRGVAVLQEIDIPNSSNELTRKDLLKFRDESELPRHEFYVKWMKQAVLKKITEVDSTRK
ncbi:MAG: NUDIX domain-containing protein [Anaerolineales bacterium]